MWRNSGNHVPPGSAGGGDTTTTPPTDTTQPPATTTPAPPAGGTNPPTTTPQPAAGGYVTVSSWPDNSVPKESTLWDIAGTWLPEGAPNWGLIWNNPLNADLKARRGDPSYIQPGDRLWVPNKLSNPRSSY